MGTAHSAHSSPPTTLLCPIPFRRIAAPSAARPAAFAVPSHTPAGISASSRPTAADRCAFGAPRGRAAGPPPHRTLRTRPRAAGGWEGPAGGKRRTSAARPAAGGGGGDGGGDGGGRGDDDARASARNRTAAGSAGGGANDDGDAYSVLEDEDLFDLDFDLDDVEDDAFLDEIMADLEDGDFLVMDDRSGEGFIVAGAELGGGDGDDGETVDDLDDEALLELLGMDDDVDAEDLEDLERILRARRDLDDLERILVGEGGGGGPMAAGGGADGRGGAAPRATPVLTPLERALLQGVVPAEAGVGSGCLPGDYGFDPLNLAGKDYFKRAQRFLSGLFPETKYDDEDDAENNSGYDGSAIPRWQREGWINGEGDRDRPAALILRDYREAEIRHGRLAMLAAVLWPLQEIIDRLLIPNNFGSTTFVYGGITLPYISLLMTAIMLLLGYLDIYAAAVKDADAGEAFLPGECFWDPLRLLDGAPDSMKRNMQERELNNGRAAMVAVLCYFLQEAVAHRPLISLPYNVPLFEPAYQIPAVQAWLDRQFQSPSPAFTFPEVGTVDFVETLREVMEEEEALGRAADAAVAGVGGGAGAGAGGGGVDVGNLTP